MNVKIPALVIGALVASLSAASAAPAPPKPKVSVRTAERAATRAVHGRALSAKYEFEDGHWQYAVMVMQGKQLWEVEVNSTTGKVLDKEKTTAAAEEQEAAADKAKASGKIAPAEKGEADEAGEKGEKGEGAK